MPDSVFEILARLYIAKLNDLGRREWRTYPERQIEALDYAISSLDRMKHGPLPIGGITELEDRLCLEFGIDRHGPRD